MKLQDVILKAIAKKITWLDAADIAGVSATTIARMRQKYEEFGYDGLYDQQRRKRHIHRVPLPTAEKVLALYQESYSGLSVRRFHQRLRSQHAIRLSYSWVKQALVGAGLITAPARPPAPRRARKSAHLRRRVHYVRPF
ncbi:MAG TPA: helix-turn-helix domain-containing protein [Bryobacteraceae bacterium]|nr:helix-turn-helix domain-containing protein [Bryobacteraceae bacterium]